MPTQSTLSLVTEKRCSRCGEIKPAAEFWRNPKTKSGLHSWCRGCANAYHGDWRRSEVGQKVTSRVTERYKQNGKRKEIETRRQRRMSARFYRLKSGKACLVCGESEVVCLDFHHVDPSTKSLRSMYHLAQRRDMTQLLDEIAKCVVLCSNCHRKVHAGVITLDDRLSWDSE